MTILGCFDAVFVPTHEFSFLPENPQGKPKLCDLKLKSNLSNLIITTAMSMRLKKCSMCNHS